MSFAITSDYRNSVLTISINAVLTFASNQKNMHKYIRHFVIILILFPISLAAQSARLYGSLSDNVNSEPLIGATIRLENTSIGAITDLNGDYDIRNIPAGTYNVVVSFIGYQALHIADIEFTESQIKQIDIKLEASTTEIGLVEIIGTISKKTVNGLLIEQKNSANVSDGISGESIRKSPDKNTGEVVRRISGTSVQDNKFVVIRGLNDRYNAAMLNGIPLPSTEPDRKAFSFEIFPAALLDNLVVYKTATPDLPGDFAGGVIRLTTKDIPDQSVMNLSIGSGYHSVSTGKEYHSYKGGKTDWLGIDDGTRALHSEIPDTKTFQSGTSNDKIGYSKYMGNDWAINDELTHAPTQSLQFSAGNKFKVLKHEMGLITALTYSHGSKTNVSERADFNTDTSKLYSYTDKKYSENTLWGGILNLTYKPAKNVKISFGNMISVNTDDALLEREGLNYESERFEKANAMTFTQNKLHTHSLTISHPLPAAGIEMKWDIGLNFSERVIPDLRKMLYTKNFIPQDEYDTLFVAQVPLGSASPNYAGKFWSNLNESSNYGSVEFAVPISKENKDQKIKFGASVLNRQREFDARVFGYRVANLSKFNWELLKSSQDTIFQANHIGVNGFRLDEITSPSDKYTSSSQNISGFLMADHKIIPKLRAVYGIRVESYSQNLHSFGYSRDTIDVDTTFVNLLPSLNLTYAINDKNNIRAALSQTLSRPEFRELAPFSFYDFTTSSSVYGNSKLIPGSIINADLRYEIYPGAGRMFSFTTFYKKFTNAIENVLYPGGAGSFSRTYENVPFAINYGIEAEARIRLNKIDSLLNTACFGNLYLSSNLAIIKSEVDLSELKNGQGGVRPLQGQSPYIINAGLIYQKSDKKGMGISLLYNRIGRRISDVGADGYLDIYEAPRNQLDFQLTKTFFGKAELKLNFSEVLDSDIIKYQDQNDSGKYEKEKDTRIYSSSPGSGCSISFSYDF